MLTSESIAAAEHYFGPMNGQLLTIAQLQEQYGLGRDLTLRICNQLPRLYTGRGRLHIFEDDWEWILRRAASEKIDLIHASQQADTIKRWIQTRKVVSE